MSVPVISIVTPSYNQGAYIGATMRSVLGLRGDFFIDYVIMDGASTDATVPTIQEYAELLAKTCDQTDYQGLTYFTPRDGRSLVRSRGVSFRWFSQRDEGQSDAINRGAALCRGEWITWICSDDLLLPDFGAMFEKTGDADVLYGDVVNIYEGVGPVWYGPAFGVETFAPRRFAGERFYLQQAGTCIRRTLWNDVGGVRKDLFWVMDYDLFIRLEEAGAGFLRFENFVAAARIHADAKTSSGSLRRLREHYQMLLAAQTRIPPARSVRPFLVYGIEYLIKKISAIAPGTFLARLNTLIVAVLARFLWRVTPPRERLVVETRFAAQRAGLVDYIETL